MKCFLRKASKFLSTRFWAGRDTFLARLETAGGIEQSYGSPVPDQMPVACSFLNEAFASRNSISLTEDLSAIATNLTLWGAPRGELTESMDERHAHSEIVGPDSGLKTDLLRLGAFILAPYTNYPLHSHEAEEIYLPISGDGEWRMQQIDYVVYRPGSIVHVEPWKPHAIRSGKEPLLMLWAWYGSIDFGAYRLEDESSVKL